MSNESPYYYLITALQSHPDSVCIKASKQEFTYSGFYKSLEPLIAHFDSKGVKPQQKVALYTDNDMLMLQAVFALWELGATAIPMNIKYAGPKLRQIEANIQPDLGFYSDPTIVEENNQFPTHRLEFDATVKFKRQEIAIKGSDLALIMFTSGSTGIPKGVPLTHKAVYLNTSLTAKRLHASAKDKILVNTPPYTTSSLIHALTMFSVGASLVIDRGFMFGSNLLSQIKENDCTGFGGVPVHFSRILAALTKTNDTGRLRFLMNSGEHLPVPVIRQIREKVPKVEIYCVYGLTEVAGRLCILDNKYLDDKSGSVGKPLEGMTVTVRDENGIELHHGSEGQLYVQGPLLTQGYLNNEKVNKIEFTKWGFATGDYGFKDQDGFVFLKGRRDDIIKVGGEKVSVKMVEEVLYDFEDFEEFVVTPWFDDNMGCVPGLQYVLKEGRTFDRAKFIRFVSERLPGTHVPVKFEEVKTIERTSSGKTVRKKAM